LEWLGPNHNYFLETEGHGAILPMRKDRGAIYKNLRGIFAKRNGICIFLDLISNGKSGGEDEAKLVRGSPELEWRCDGGSSSST
jgi:hypothetical protein